jgi:hypothetical protein
MYNSITHNGERMNKVFVVSGESSHAHSYLPIGTVAVGGHDQRRLEVHDGT